MSTHSHHAAVAIVPPEERWEPIQAIRRIHDKHVERWMPHVNLLYPFLARAELYAAGLRLARVCGEIPAFNLTFATFRFFTHPSGRCTLWLSPEPAKEIVELQNALLAEFPDCDDLNRFPAGFTPHLSVGQCADERTARRLQAEFQAGWEPLSFVLNSVALLAREADTPFAVRQRIDLSV